MRDCERGERRVLVAIARSLVGVEQPRQAGRQAGNSRIVLIRFKSDIPSRAGNDVRRRWGGNGESVLEAGGQNALSRTRASDSRHFRSGFLRNHSITLGQRPKTARKIVKKLDDKTRPKKLVYVRSARKRIDTHDRRKIIIE